MLVFDRDDNYVNGLEPFQFHLYDNGKEQNIQVDVAYQPISLVIVLQVNAHVEGVIPQVRKIGNLIAPLMIGEQGEAAVIGFDSRIRLLQDWTSDSDKITKSVKDIYAGSSSNRVIDAVAEATRMLRKRPRIAAASSCTLAKRAIFRARPKSARRCWRCSTPISCSIRWIFRE